MVTYKNKKYLTRDLLVRDEDGDEFTITIAEDSLANAISLDRSFSYVDKDGEFVDSKIHSYVDKSAFKLTEKQWKVYCWKYVDLGGLAPIGIEREIKHENSKIR